MIARPEITRCVGVAVSKAPGNLVERFRIMMSQENRLLPLTSETLDRPLRDLAAAPVVAPAAAVSATEPAHLREYLAVVLKRKWLILSLVDRRHLARRHPDVPDAVDLRGSHPDSDRAEAAQHRLDQPRRRVRPDPRQRPELLEHAAPEAQDAEAGAPGHHAARPPEQPQLPEPRAPRHRHHRRPAPRLLGRQAAGRGREATGGRGRPRHRRGRAERRQPHARAGEEA